MDKTVLIIARIVFGTVLAVFCVAFVYWEAFAYLPKKSDKTAVRLFGENQKTGAIIGQSADNSGKEPGISEEIKTGDARPEIIKKYLTKYKSPLVDYSDMIFQLSQDYGFEYYWIVAIAQQESNLCKKIPEGSHNCWGYGIHKAGTLKFDNYELALKSYAEYLSREYFKKGLNTPELIMRKYCPSSNGSWAYGVRHFIDEMESGKF